MKQLINASNQRKLIRYFRILKIVNSIYELRIMLPVLLKCVYFFEIKQYSLLLRFTVTAKYKKFSIRKLQYPKTIRAKN